MSKWRPIVSERKRSFWLSVSAKTDANSGPAEKSISVAQNKGCALLATHVA